jgi:hypothetical protein
MITNTNEQNVLPLCAGTKYKNVRKFRGEKHNLVN